ncbi:MAG: tyrosine-type recombinase/integrase, partial [Eubacteriales bacterium]|nr:tyrosine-type recombinase/integrase [Eubacteriales bacterium]
MEHHINSNMLYAFADTLREEEKSIATIEKYVRDIKSFLTFVGQDAVVTKSTVIQYKQFLSSDYTVVSINSKLVALNRFFKANGWFDCMIRLLKIQKDTFRAQERELSREEYVRLLHTAKKKGKQRLYLLMETICATGIRVSELKFITMEAIRARYARVNLKGKTRTVILPTKLCQKLSQYCKIRKIKSGCI